MLFNSYGFIFAFLPIMFFGYFFLTKRRLVAGSRVWLVCGSLVFYSWWNPIYLPLILLSMLVNYVIGTRLSVLFYDSNSSKNWRKFLLIIGIVFNLSLISYFKYTDFFIENFNNLFNLDMPLKNIILPLAISFFTFQQIAYLVDSYRGETKEYKVINYMLFVTFFPQLIAGPIVHHKEMMPQFSSKYNLLKNYRNIAVGLFIFSMGLFKKVVIADSFSVWADAGFDQLDMLDFFMAWSTSLSYTFQLYFDFSGYTDMAIGAALLFNIRLPINFNSPYKATSIQDFWRRWHMTLSRFLRDYIYIPLGGNKKGYYLTYVNLLATFLIGGIWHGASWMFVVWGGLHGVALIIHRVWQQLGMRMWTWLAWLVTFNFINITWVFFRATDIDSAFKVLKGMMDWKNALSISIEDAPTSSLAWGGPLIDYMSNYLPHGFFINIFAYFLIIPAFIIIFFKNTAELSGYSVNNNNISSKSMAYTVVLFVLASYFMLVNSSTVFLYFNF